MPEPIPEEAVGEATEAYSCAWTSGVTGHETLVRIVLEAAAPILADQVRREVADQFRAFAARLRAVPDDGLTLGQTWDRDTRAMEYDRLADVIMQRVSVATETEADIRADERRKTIEVMTARLRRAAAGRREYDRGEPPTWAHEALQAEAATLETAVRVLEDPMAMLGLIPSWMWTAEEEARFDEPSPCEVAIDEARADERRKVAEQITAYEDLLGSIWLYIGWRYVTKQLTTEQKEIFAAAVESSSRRLNDDDPSEPFDVDRWWRDDAPIRQIGDARDPR